MSREDKLENQTNSVTMKNSLMRGFPIVTFGEFIEFGRILKWCGKLHKEYIKVLTATLCSTNKYGTMAFKGAIRVGEILKKGSL